MPEYKRTLLNHRYHRLEIYDCQKEIIAFAAQLASENVSIENFMHFGRTKASFQFQIKSKKLSLIPVVKRFNIDFSCSRNEFVQLIDLWDEEGCYAVFYSKERLQFKATDLQEDRRYPALNNFGWTLEISVAGAASAGWSYFTSPEEQIIEKIVDQLK